MQSTITVADQDEKALFNAVLRGELEEITRLVTSTEVGKNIGSEGIGKQLFTAEACGRIGAMRLLLKLGAKVDVVNDNDITPLMGAACYGRWKMLDLLLQYGADPNFVREVDNHTPLKCSASTKMGFKCAELLIAAGANPNLPPDDDQPALMIAARKNRVQLLEILLKAGANPEQQCKLPWAQGWTALDHAINERRYKAVKILQRVTRTPPIAFPGQVG